MTLGKGQFHKSNLEMPMLRCRDLSEKKLHLNFPVRRESAGSKGGPYVGALGLAVPHHDHEAAHGLVITAQKAEGRCPRQPTEGLRAGSLGARSPSESQTLSTPLTVSGRTQAPGISPSAGSPRSRLATARVTTNPHPPCGPWQVAAPNCARTHSLRPGQKDRRQHTSLNFFSCLSPALCPPTLCTLGPLCGHGQPRPAPKPHTPLLAVGPGLSGHTAWPEPCCRSTCSRAS